MFVKSYKIPGRRLVAIGAVCLVVLGFVVYGVGERLSGRAGAQQVETGTRADRRATQGKAKTDAERAAFIAQFGWEVEAEPLEITEVVIPEEFDDVYTRYNELQKQQGYDLEKQKGERVKRYTYRVMNYPDAEQEVHISLMVLDGKVIGGDVSSTALGGFMQGFAKDSAVMSMGELEPSLQEHSTLADEEDEAPLEETMADELDAMEQELLEESAEPTEAQMPTD